MRMQKGFYLIFIVLTSLSWMISCSDKSTSPSGPHGDGDGSSASIDAAGGELTADDFSLTVPAGAFEEAAELEIGPADEYEAFIDETASSVYLLTGLPETFQDNLRICIRYTGDVSSTPFIAMGWISSDLTPGDTGMVHTLLEAADSSGFLVAEIPARPFSLESLTKETGTGVDGDGLPANLVTFQAMMKRQTWETPSFLIKYPAYLETHMPEIEDLLEDNLTILIDVLKFQGMHHDWTSRIETVIKDMPSEARASLKYPEDEGKEVNGPQILQPLLNLRRLSADQSRFTDLRTGSGSVLLGLLAADVIHFGKYFNFAEGLWIINAVITWAEEVFLPVPDTFIPTRFPGHEMAPFRGMRAGAGNEAGKDNDHGVGMSALIKYLTGDPRFGIEGPARVFRSMGQDMNSGDAVLYNVDGLVTEWLPDFFQAYISGGVYEVDGSVFTDPAHLSGTWTIDSDDDTEKIFSPDDAGVGTFPDLSAKLFLVNMAHPDLADCDHLLIDADGGVTDQGITVLLFGIQSGRPEFMGRENAVTANLDITNMKTNLEAGVSQYLIAVVNSTHDAAYTGSSYMDLTLQFTKCDEPPDDPPDPQAVPPFSQCQLHFTVRADVFKTLADGTTTTYPASYFSVSTFGKIPVQGEDYYFYGEATNTYPSGDVTYDSFNLTLKSDLSSIQRLEWNQNHTSNEGDCLAERLFIAGNIPLESFQEGAFHHYELKGSEVCSLIQDFQNNTQCIQWNGVETGAVQGSPLCDEQSEIDVFLEIDQ